MEPHKHKPSPSLHTMQILVIATALAAGLVACLAIHFIHGWPLHAIIVGISLAAATAITLALRRNDRDRQRIEQEMQRRSHQLLSALARQSALLAAIPAEVYFLDAQLRYITVNQSLADALGKEESQLIGKTDAELLPIECATSLMTANRQVLSSGQPLTGLEEHIRTHHGHDRWLLTNRVPLLNGDGRTDGVVGISVDITQHKATEAALRASEEGLALALEGGGLGTWNLHLPSGQLTVDERYAAMLGEQRQDLRLDHAGWEERIHPDDRAAMRRQMNEHLQGRSSQFAMEYRMRRKHGAWIWIQAQGKVLQRDADDRPLRMAGTHLDISTRVHIERQLQQERELFVGGLVVVFRWRSAPPFPVIHASMNTAEVLGYPAEHFITGQVEYDACIHPADCERVQQQRLQLLAGGPGHAQHEPYRFRHGNGGWIWLLDHSSLVVDENGRMSDMLGYVFDISDRVAAEHRQRRALAEAERFNRLMLGREERILSLKEEVNEALSLAQQEPRYVITRDADGDQRDASTD